MSKRKKRKLQGTPDGWVYVLNIGYDNLYKIGMTQHLPSRVKALSKANPKLRIEMAYLVLNVKAVEAKFQAKYTDEHYKWELFTLLPHNLRSIRRHLREENKRFLRSREEARRRSSKSKRAHSRRHHQQNDSSPGVQETSTAVLSEDKQQGRDWSKEIAQAEKELQEAHAELN